MLDLNYGIVVSQNLEHLQIEIEDTIYILFTTYKVSGGFKILQFCWPNQQKYMELNVIQNLSQFLASRSVKLEKFKIFFTIMAVIWNNLWCYFLNEAMQHK